jgi:hypothetical protein
MEFKKSHQIGKMIKNLICILQSKQNNLFSSLNKKLYFEIENIVVRPPVTAESVACQGYLIWTWPLFHGSGRPFSFLIMIIIIIFKIFEDTNTKIIYLKKNAIRLHQPNRVTFLSVIHFFGSEQFLEGWLFHLQIPETNNAC